MAHGRTLRNENCYNCHDRDELDQLHTAEGAKLKFEQATLLCASCHGTTYRDWEAGAHGRTGGVLGPEGRPHQEGGMHLLPRPPRAGVHRPHPHARTPPAPSPPPPHGAPAIPTRHAL
jgi:hypothetical protein